MDSPDERRAFAEDFVTAICEGPDMAGKTPNVKPPIEAKYRQPYPIAASNGKWWVGLIAGLMIALAEDIGNHEGPFTKRDVAGMLATLGAVASAYAIRPR